LFNRDLVFDLRYRTAVSLSLGGQPVRSGRRDSGRVANVGVLGDRCFPGHGYHRLHLRMAKRRLPMAVNLPENNVVSQSDVVSIRARVNSLRPMACGTACCGIEFMATASPRYDVPRFGSAVMRFSPCECDLMIVAGQVVIKMLP